MIKLSNTKLILVLTRLLVLLVIAKAISLSLLWYLPSDGVELEVKDNYQPKYQRVNFKNMIENKKTKQSEDIKKSTSSISITNMLLKALYGTKKKGYIIVAMKSSPADTSIIAIGESYKGYELIEILSQSGKLHKNGLDFILKLDEIKNKSAITRLVDEQEITPEVSRKDIHYYAKNPDKIWKDISLKEVRNGKKIKGFKVNKINMNSRFASLGLRKNDLIIKANNVKLESYKDALEIYKNIDKLDTVQIIVLRNNQEVELVYEIN